MMKYWSFVFLFFVATEASAFGSSGHSLICKIAFQTFTPEAKAEVTRLIESTRYSSFADACRWADYIRRDRKYDFAKPHHYINLPKNSSKVQRTSTCRRRGCVLDAVEVYTAVLSGANLSGFPMRNKSNKAGLYVSDRGEALMFLAHFVGDIHQPLHVSYADDRGGNKIRVKIASRKKKENLHWVWDSYLVSRSKHGQKKLETELLDKTQNNNRSRLKEGSPLDWAQESFDLTQKIYRDLPSNKILSESYYRRNNLVIKKQIERAGYRLGEVINQAVSDFQDRHPNNR